MRKLQTLRHKLSPSKAVKVRQPKNVGPWTSFYLQREWRSLIDRIKRMRGARCEDPDHQPEHPRSGIRLYGDHIVELKDGGAPLDPRNVLLRCPPCHQRKTAEMRRIRFQEPGIQKSGVVVPRR